MRTSGGDDKGWLIEASTGHEPASPQRAGTTVYTSSDRWLLRSSVQDEEPASSITVFGSGSGSGGSDSGGSDGGITRVVSDEGMVRAKSEDYDWGACDPDPSMPAPRTPAKSPAIRSSQATDNASLSSSSGISVNTDATTPDAEEEEQQYQRHNTRRRRKKRARRNRSRSRRINYHRQRLLPVT
eukprot:TRINITY_DN6127_c0_g1_i1.p1 TRINITY_DN6127_c0_g1~~TRINITY_DN6127_c0_g1_i1.p1  ORF type:complete len:184 (-),score=27.90 TRINITY_DN6127_c0_g1_i1:7-558(-)